MLLQLIILLTQEFGALSGRALYHQFAFNSWYGDPHPPCLLADDFKEADQEPPDRRGITDHISCFGPTIWTMIQQWCVA